MNSPFGESLNVLFSEFLKKSSTVIVGGGVNATLSSFFESLQAIISKNTNESSASFFIDYKFSYLLEDAKLKKKLQDL